MSCESCPFKRIHNMRLRAPTLSHSRYDVLQTAQASEEPIILVVPSLSFPVRKGDCF